MLVEAKDTIAIVVDYQEKIVPAMAEKEVLIKNSVKLLEGLTILDIPIIVTQQYTKGLGMTIEEIQKAIGSNFTYLDKTCFSAALEETIQKKIESYHRKTVIICGIEAHVCVLQTALDLLEKGYKVLMVDDCIASRRKNDKEVGIQRAVIEGAMITTYEAILFELLKKAGTEQFKLISKLVK